MFGPLFCETSQAYYSNNCDSCEVIILSDEKLTSITLIPRNSNAFKLTIFCVSVVSGFRISSENAPLAVHIIGGFKVWMG